MGEIFNVLSGADLTPLKPGEIRKIEVRDNGEGEVSNYKVRIRCFTGNPPSYQECEACGEISVKSGQFFTIETDKYQITQNGNLEVSIEDEVGRRQIIRFKVGQRYISL